MYENIRELKLEDCHDSFRKQSAINLDFSGMMSEIELLNKKLEKKHSDYRLKLGYLDDEYSRYILFTIKAETGKYVYQLLSAQYFSEFVYSFGCIVDVLCLFEI